MKKKIILILIILLFNLIIFSRLNNLYIDYTYEFNNDVPHSLYLGYDFGNIPLKIQIGSQNDFQFSALLSTFANIKKLYIEPYVKYAKYAKELSVGFKFSLNHIYFNYNINKLKKSTFGAGFYLPLIRFGKDTATYVESKSYIKEVVGNDIKINMIVKDKGFVSENINIFYTLNDSDKIYAGKSNDLGEIKLKISNITKAGLYKLKIFDSNKKIKEITLELLPDKPYKVSFDFDKNFIFTDNEELLKIKDIRVYDKYNNEIDNYDIKFMDFKILGSLKKIQYSYLNNYLILSPFKESGKYDIYYEIEIDGIYLNGLKSIVVKENPKNIVKIDVNINYLGNENNYMVFEIKRPDIYFSNSNIECAERFFVYLNEKRLNIRNGKVKIPIEQNLSKNLKFEVSVEYYNFSTTVYKKVDIVN